MLIMFGCQDIFWKGSGFKKKFFLMAIVLSELNGSVRFWLLTSLSHWITSYWWSQTAHTISKIYIFFAAQERSAASKNASPNAAIDKKDNNQWEDSYGYDCRSQAASVAPAVNSIVNFSINSAHSFDIVIRCLVWKHLGVCWYP